ncbi:MAG: hypothetical protein ACRBCK_06395 [Alphaproteobacteria bacterium]
MDHEKIQKYLTYVIKGLFITLGVLILLAIVVLEMTKKPQEEIDAILAEQRREMQMRVEGVKVRPKEERHLPDPWPANMNVAYPDIILMDDKGQELLLSDFMGKVVVLEFIDMSSPISQAQSGSLLLGAYGDTVKVDRSRTTFANVVRDETGEGFTYPSANTVELKVIVYAEDGGLPTVDDAAKWANHFDLSSEESIIVAVPKTDLRSPITQGLIGGYHLLDKQSRLRVDSVGTIPRHNLEITLVPLAVKLTRN